jgi:hypothetical protein
MPEATLARRPAAHISRPRVPGESELTDLVQEFFAKSRAQWGYLLNYSAGIGTLPRESRRTREHAAHGGSGARPDHRE